MQDRTFGETTPRILRSQGLAADGKVSAKSLRCISYGETEVELSNVEQLVEISQAKAIADCLQKLGDSGEVDGRTLLRDVVEKLHARLTGPTTRHAVGLDMLSRFSNPNGSY